jgi:hypothetical protein
MGARSIRGAVISIIQTRIQFMAVDPSYFAGCSNSSAATGHQEITIISFMRTGTCYDDEGWNKLFTSWIAGRRWLSGS